MRAGNATVPALWCRHANGLTIVAVLGIVAGGVAMRSRNEDSSNGPRDPENCSAGTDAMPCPTRQTTGVTVAVHASSRTNAPMA